MLNRILEFSIRQRLMVILLTLGMGVWGVFNFQKLPIDATIKPILKPQDVI